MARRASSGVNSQTLLIGAAVLLLVLGGGYWLINRKPAGFDSPELNVLQARDNSRSLAGNKNHLTGRLIDRRIGESGSIITLQVGENPNVSFYSIVIPDDFKGGNLNLEDEYTFEFEHNNKGLAVALDVKQL